MKASNGLGRYDQIVKDKYGKDAFVLDMKGQDGNVDGKFDRGDYIVYKENGQTKMKPVDKNEFYDTQYRQSIVDAATSMDKGIKDRRIGFQGSLQNQQYNPKYWKEVELDGKKIWRIRDKDDEGNRINPSDAINDVFANDGGKYKLDCAASTNLISLKAKLDTIGAGDFNKQYDKMHIRGWSTWNADHNGKVGWDHNGAMTNVNGERSGKGKVEDLQAGDFTYFTNRGRAQNSGPSQGENAYYLGNDENGKPMFFGNPIGIIHKDTCSYGTLSTVKGTTNPEILAQEDRQQEVAY